MRPKTLAVAPGTLPGMILPGMTLLGALLAGCAGPANFQDDIGTAAVNRATEAGEFTLPRGQNTGAPIALWDSVLIACPYSDTGAFPEPYAKAAKGLKTASSDAAQWLLFAKGTEAKRISVERSAVDFCYDDSPTVAYQHTQMWTAEKFDGAWLMTAVGPRIPG